MSNERFIELLNLYLDDEILPEDLSELMDETRRDPRRQQLFFDYCRIHKACSQMGSAFAPRRPRRSLRQTVYALGGLAAAIALLAMAGRNLMPYAQGNRDELAAIQERLPQTRGPYAADALDAVFADAPFFMVASDSNFDPWKTNLSGVQTRQAAPFVLRVGDMQPLLESGQANLLSNSWRWQGRADFGFQDFLSASDDPATSLSRFDFSANGFVPIASPATGSGLLSSKLRLNY